MVHLVSCLSHKILLLCHVYSCTSRPYRLRTIFAVTVVYMASEICRLDNLDHFWYRPLHLRKNWCLWDGLETAEWQSLKTSDLYWVQNLCWIFLWRQWLQAISLQLIQRVRKEMWMKRTKWRKKNDSEHKKIIRNYIIEKYEKSNTTTTKGWRLCHNLSRIIPHTVLLELFLALKL